MFENLASEGSGVFASSFLFCSWLEDLTIAQSFFEECLWFKIGFRMCVLNEHPLRQEGRNVSM